MPDASLPERIGPYRIVSLLGQGGMGRVYKAVQEPLERDVALKVLIGGITQEPEFLDRFLREAKTSAKVIHPHVVTCYDFGEADGHAYMAMEYVPGGDACERIKREEGLLDESLALGIVRDAAKGLEAIEMAGLIHRDIKPANIFIDNDGVAKLADLGLARMSSGDDAMTQAGMIMGTPSFISPEQARGDEQIDIRTDIYALGATLYNLLSGKLPYHADSPMGTLHKVLFDPIPDVTAANPHASKRAIDIITRCMAKERDQRYRHAKDLRLDLDAALEGRSLPSGQRKAAAVAEPTGPEGKRQQISVDAPLRKQAQFDNKKLRLVAKRVHVSKDGCLAWLVLAPGASFPLILLQAVLEYIGIEHGLDDSAILQSTRASQTPRKIVLARGDAPSPGLSGRDVYGQEIPPLPEPIQLRVSDDGMEAYALFEPGRLVDRNVVKRAILTQRLRFGFDEAAVHRISDGPAEASGRLVIARGRPVVEGRAAGFVLLGDIHNTTIDQVAASNLQKVRKGDVLAIWDEGRSPKTGMDVYGERRQSSPVPERCPEDCKGDGTDISRDAQGQLVLKATRNGLCQQQVDGCIRVIGAVEVSGDLGPDSGPITTEELVVVRGDVKAGAEISTSSDIVILGDLHDANIQCGGSLQVEGVIGDGENPIIAVDTIEAEGVEVRKVMAGNLVIKGVVRGSELIATGDIQVDHIVGGRLLAGGTIRAKRAGDVEGTTTELWAGHHLEYAEQNEMAKVCERRLTVERERIIEEQRNVQSDMTEASSRAQRLVGAQYVNRQAGSELHRQLSQLQERMEDLEHKSEDARKRLAHQRQVLGELGRLEDNESAAVIIEDVAHRGTIVKLADADADLLDKDEIAYRQKL